MPSSHWKLRTCLISRIYLFWKSDFNPNTKVLNFSGIRPVIRDLFFYLLHLYRAKNRITTHWKAASGWTVFIVGGSYAVKRWRCEHWHLSTASRLWATAKHRELSENLRDKHPLRYSSLWDFLSFLRVLYRCCLIRTFTTVPPLAACFSSPIFTGIDEESGTGDRRRQFHLAQLYGIPLLCRN